MNILLLLPIILTFGLFFVPVRQKFYHSLFISLLLTSVSSYFAIILFTQTKFQPLIIDFYSIRLTIDSLSAFFILITNFAMLMGVIYSKNYLKPYEVNKTSLSFSLHYFSYLWLHLSMIFVLILRDGLPFLIVWELMAVSSFMLILFEAEKVSTLKTAVNYLIQMHIGFVFLLIAFLILSVNTGEMSFDSLALFFAKFKNIPLFLVFFVGFGIKAGFIPLHTWLPDAHPAAPSNVSAVMSGIMIKMGIYGILRVLTYVQTDLYTIGLIILAVSSVSGLIAIIFATIQKDIKKLLAYSSIENIGIIGVGIGIGVIGIGTNNPYISMLGFVGAFLHILNHSLFKPLLFFSAGSVYMNYHTRNIDSLGGVIHKMPKTTAIFLVGSLAICGLPPLNGFISEILIYCGLFNGLTSYTFYNSLIMLAAIITLVLIGGLALFAFTKAFGVIFLGEERSNNKNIKEGSFVMLLPQFIIVFLIFLVGLFPVIFIKPITSIVSNVFKLKIDYNIISITNNLMKISIVSLLLIVFIVVLYLIRKYILNKRKITVEPTWGCGYTNPTPNHQYTGTSYSNNFNEIANPILNTKTKYRPIGLNNIFPKNSNYTTVTNDIFKRIIIRIVDLFIFVLKRIARLQTGLIQHYILYAFVFILIIFLLLYLNVL